MMNHKTSDIRNVVLVGHGAVGKTTLADRMLFQAGVETRAGSVDDGTSMLDTDDEEKERKHSVFSALAHFERNGKRINLIDTPGYPDFIGQAIGAMRAVETAVITICATAGIEVNTRKVFERAQQAGLARMIVLNKCDMENIAFAELVDSIRQTFGQACVLMNVPVGLGADFKGVVSTLNIPDNVPDGVVIQPKDVNQEVMDAIVEGDESLMERYLEGGALSPEELSTALTKAMVAGTLIPILCTSAKTGVGVEELMDALTNWTPSPAEVPRWLQNGGGERVPVKPDADAPLVAQVFKTRIDPFVAKMSYLRLYSGKLAKDSTATNARADKSLKFSQILDVQGGTQHPIDEALAGDIVAVVKMDDLAVGDTLTNDAEGLSMGPISFPTPMIGLAVEPKSRADQQKISGALHKIEEEDQTFRVLRESQTHEMVMQGMSELHLLIVKDRLHKRDKVDVITHQPKIPYREAVAGHAEGSYRHKKQSGGSGQFAEVHVRVSHIPRDVNPEEYFTKDRFPGMRSYHYDPDLNFAFIDRITGGTIPNQYIPAVEKGIRERMTRGVIAGYQVQDVAAEVFYGKDHPVDSNETAFRIAGSQAFRKVFGEAKPVLLEPIVHLEITVPSDSLGDATSDLNGRRGRVEGMEGAEGGLQVIKAHAPLSEVMTYARALSSMTGGQGSFTMEFSHYEMMPPNEQEKVVAAASKDHEDDE